MSEACAKIVQRDDPSLYATAMMAKEPLRGALMVLYAFDIELSRAVHASREPGIGEIRLQWWRDVIDAATRGEPAEAHEVAAPLAQLIEQSPEDTGLLDAMIEGHQRELDAPFDRRAHGDWADERFGARLCYAINLSLTRAAAIKLGTRIDPGAAAGSEATNAVSKHILPLGRALGWAFSIQHARRRAANSEPVLIPGVTGEDAGAIAKGDLPEALRDGLRQTAERYVRQIAFSRESLVLPDKRMVAALLPLRRAERVLTLVAGPDFSIRKLNNVDGPFGGLRLSWNAARGRW